MRCLRAVMKCHLTFRVRCSVRSYFLTHIHSLYLHLSPSLSLPSTRSEIHTAVTVVVAAAAAASNGMSRHRVRYECKCVNVYDDVSKLACQKPGKVTCSLCVSNQQKKNQLSKLGNFIEHAQIVVCLFKQIKKSSTTILSQREAKNIQSSLSKRNLLGLFTQ